MCKNITFYSTCQGVGIKYYLQKVFPDYNYYIIKNYNSIKDNLSIPYDILNKTDIFIYQHLDSKFDKYSTDDNGDIINNLPTNCIKIKIPYIYNSSFWSISCMLYRDAIIDFNILNDLSNIKLNNNIKTILNRNVIDKLKNIYSIDEIIDMYDNKQINFNYEERFIHDINYLKEKESDVIVSDFIIKYHKKYQLFFNCNHPTSYLLAHAANQIIEKLGSNQTINVFELDKCDFKELNFENISSPISSYDMDYFKFEFNCKINDTYIKNLIKII